MTNDTMEAAPSKSGILTAIVCIILFATIFIWVGFNRVQSHLDTQASNSDDHRQSKKVASNDAGDISDEQFVAEALKLDRELLRRHKEKKQFVSLANTDKRHHYQRYEEYVNQLQENLAQIDRDQIGLREGMIQRLKQVETDIPTP